MKKFYQTKQLSVLITFLFLQLALYSQNAWINEIHYDNAGTDEGEFIEVVIENPGNYELGDFQVILYNGSGGASYNSKSLDDFIVGATVGSFTIYYFEYPSNGIQNGSPDGMALSYQGVLISGQFLSYEGTFYGSDGPATSLESSDIGVEETSGTPVGESLQLSGNGASYSDFIWNQPASETPGQLNNNQDFGSPDPEPSNYPTGFTADATGLTIQLNWTDAIGNQLPSGYLIKGSTSSNITPPVDGSPEDNDLDFSDGQGAYNVGFGNETFTFYRLDTETEYFFEIFPYSNAGANVNYKTDGNVPSTDGITDFKININYFETGNFGTWTTYSVASDNDWQVLDYGGAIETEWFAQMNGYNENELSNDWLISPVINLNNYSNELILFWTAWKYGNADDELMLKYSTDYTGGDPTAATWAELDFAKADDDDTWTNSGFISLSDIIGEEVYIAFQYLSNGSPRRWNVDQIDITGTVAIPVINVTSPIGGDIWEQGSTHDIEWDAANTLNYVKIELTSDASSGNPTWVELTDDVLASDGSWTWNIPSDQTISYDCQIRITDYASDAEGLSGIFWIVEPFIAPNLVITEIMYNPPETDTDTLEYIEVFNNSDETIVLDGYYFSAGIDFTFENTEIEAGEYIVIAVDSNSMFNTFGIHTLQWEDGALSNSGELIEISNPDGFVVDAVEYDDQNPWPTITDGFGPSLDFCNPGLDNSTADHWTASNVFAAVNANNDTIWATPGTGCNEVLYAIFEADTTVVLVGGHVNYTDLSTGGPTAWEWTFEGGTPGTSVEQNPSGITYNQPGSFAVSLTVTNDGGFSTNEITNYIHVGYAPIVMFTASDTAIEVNATVDFTDLSQNNPHTWEWTFEGGNPATSSDQNPSGIKYSTMGTYDVTLTVYSIFGSETLTKTDYIKVGPVGVEEKNAKVVRIFPNPTSGKLLVESPNALMIEVYTIIGEKVCQSVPSGVSTTIDLSGKENGLYLVKLTCPDNTIIMKRIIKD